MSAYLCQIHSEHGKHCTSLFIFPGFIHITTSIVCRLLEFIQIWLLGEFPNCFLPWIFHCFSLFISLVVYPNISTFLFRLHPSSYSDSFYIIICKFSRRPSFRFPRDGFSGLLDSFWVQHMTPFMLAAADLFHADKNVFFSNPNFFTDFPFPL